MLGLLPALLLALLQATCVTLGAKPPSYFRLCKRNDPKVDKCIQDSINSLKPYFVKGIQELQIPTIKPLVIKKVVIQQGNGGPVSVKLTCNNLNLDGLEEYFVPYVKSDLDNYRLNISLDLPLVQMSGVYQGEGRILLLPLRGSGDSNMTVWNVEGTGLIEGTPETHDDGKVYMHVNKFEVKVNRIKELNMYFANLLGGKQDRIEAALNSFLNENWKAIWVEVKETMEQTISEVFLQMSRRVFHAIPYDDLFLP